MNNSSCKQIIEHIKRQHYHPPKPILCSQHYLPKELFCIQQNCPSKGQLKCSDCNHEHPLLSFQKIVPKLSKWVLAQWQQVNRENAEIFNQWRNTEINLNYCIDILKQILERIHGHHSQWQKLLYLPALEYLTKSTHQMFGSHCPQELVKQFFFMNHKYHLFENSKTELVRCEISYEERVQRLIKNKAIAKNSKEFSQKALLFSEKLIETINNKMHIFKRQANKKIGYQKIFCLNDLQKQKYLENVGELRIEFKKKNKKNQKNIQKYLEHCHNLRSLYVNNKQGNIMDIIWEKIISKVQDLRMLKELKLNLRQRDLIFLSKLFSHRPNSIRNIEKLSLQISDQPHLDTNNVAMFCNCFQLRNLYLTLTRDNLKASQIVQFLNELRLHTSLSQLHMKQFSLNLSQNKIIELKDRNLLEKIFTGKCLDIKNIHLQF